MKRLFEATKEYFYGHKLNIILSLIFLVGVSSYIFKSQIGSFIWDIRCKSPVEFHDVRIEFPKGIIFTAGKESLVFCHWEYPKAFLHVGKINLRRMTKEYLLYFFEKKNFHILETKDIYFKDYPSFTISYIDTSWMYNKATFVIPKNLKITYQGTKENYKDFKDIIDSMEFLSKDK